MNRCKVCVTPDTRPDINFVDGVCSACRTHAKKPEIDWDSRKEELLALLDRHDGKCIVPSSGGKDSVFQAIYLKELGADVTAVTARTCHLTDVGRKNIDNLARYVKTIEVVPNMTVRAKLNRMGLELVGDISHPEHMAIFSTPFKMAKALDTPLIFYGENPQHAYGGPMKSDEAKTMTSRWVSEFGGFLGLRPSDFVGMEGITERDMEDYQPVDYGEAHFLGQYVEWDSRSNVKFAQDHGMRVVIPSAANLWAGENMDNMQTGIHDFFMFLKYGFGRGCSQVSVDVRNGVVDRNAAVSWTYNNDGLYPHFYMGVPLDEILDGINMKRSDFDNLVEQYRVSH